MDERMQQLFMMCNAAGVTKYSSPHQRTQPPRVTTYDVIPVSPTLGLVEFLPHTTTLKELLVRDDRKKTQHVEEHVRWLHVTHGQRCRAKGWPRGSEVFSVDKEESVRKLRMRQASVDAFSLKAAFLKCAGGLTLVQLGDGRCECRRLWCVL